MRGIVEKELHVLQRELFNFTIITEIIYCSHFTDVKLRLSILVSYCSYNKLRQT